MFRLDVVIQAGLVAERFVAELASEAELVVVVVLSAILLLLAMSAGLSVGTWTMIQTFYYPKTE